MPAIAHLLHGFTGAGKTTFALQLEQQLPAIRFSPDEWMTALYGENPPAGLFQEYHARISDLIWQIALRALAANTDVILDFGFWSRAGRDAARSRLKTTGATFRLYQIVCPEDVMRQRVLQRSAMLPQGEVWIDDAAIGEFKQRFEPLGDDEERIVIDNAGASERQVLSVWELERK
jgi:predicted kinase